jgi:DNA-binding transcriptional LysR family regulator
VGTNAFIDVLPEMVAFARVAALGSFSAAAAQLGLTPSAISRQVTRLEKTLGVQLIQRTTRRLRLTEAGVEAFAHCSDLVLAAQATLDVAQSFAQVPRGLVRLSAPREFARSVLHPPVMSFLRLWPEVDVQLIVEDHDIDPIRDGVDLVVRITDDPPPGLAARPLMEVDQVLCATPEHLARAGVPAHPRDLLAHPCLYLGEREHDNLWRFHQGDDEASVRVRGRYVANHAEVRLEGALAGLGIACLPTFIAAPALDDGRLVRVLADWRFDAPYGGRALLMYPPSRFLLPKCRVLIDHLADALSTRWTAR